MGCKPYRKLPVTFSSSRNQDAVLSIFRGYNDFPSEPDTRYVNFPAICEATLSTTNVSQRKYSRGLPSPVTNHTVSPLRKPPRLSVTMPKVGDGRNGSMTSGLWYWTKWVILISWWSRWDSNPRPPRCHRGALPTAPRPHRGELPS